MKTSRFGITFFKPNKTTGRLDFIPASEVDFSKQFFLVTESKWLYIFNTCKVRSKDWEKQYVYCPANEEALDELYSEYPELKIIEIIKQVDLSESDGVEDIGYYGVFCSSYDFEFSDNQNSISKLLREIFTQPPFTKKEVKKWLKEAKVPEAGRIRYLYDRNFNRV